MHVPYAVYKLWIITTRMSTAIAYSFMTMDNNRRDNNNAEQQRTPRRNNSSDRFKNNINFDTVSESGTMSKTGSGKRRPRKRSTSGSRSNKPPKVSFFLFLCLLLHNGYNQATTKLAFHSNETSKVKLSIIIIKVGYLLLSSRCMPNYTKKCSFLHAHYTET